MKWMRDPIYDSYWFHKFINRLMLKGYKSRSEKSVYQAMRNIKFKANVHPYLSFFALLETLRPSMYTVPKRIGRKIHQIPIPLYRSSGYRIVLKWMSHSIKSRDDSELSNRISGELLALITNSKSMVFKKREELFKTILDNRTFSNFRWR